MDSNANIDTNILPMLLNYPRTAILRTANRNQNLLTASRVQKHQTRSHESLSWDSRAVLTSKFTVYAPARGTESPEASNENKSIQVLNVNMQISKTTAVLSRHSNCRAMWNSPMWRIADSWIPPQVANACSADYVTLTSWMTLYCAYLQPIPSP
jgi:hypothetical protein